MQLESIINKIRDDLSIEPDQVIEAETELLMSGIIDSLGVVSLIAWLETEVGSAIDPGLVTLENFDRPSAIVTLCEQVATGA